MVRIFSNEDVVELLDIGGCVDVLAEAYADLADGRAISSRRVDTLVPADPPAEYHAMKSMGGALPRHDIQAMRLDSDLLRWPERNGAVRREKLTSAQDDSLRIGKENGLVLLYSTATGEPMAMLPDGELQRHRVAATMALAARLLAPPHAGVQALLGSGWQAEMALRATTTVLDLAEIRVFSPTREHRESFAQAMDADLDAEVRAVGSADEAVTGTAPGDDSADVVQTVTNALQPTIQEAWLEPGRFVSTVKAVELDPAHFGAFDTLAIHSRAHRGPRHNVVEGDRVPDLVESGYPPLPDEGIELADLVANPDAVAVGDDVLTGFVNNIGLGLQFAACGHLLLERAAGTDVGTEIPTEWFLQDIPQR